MENEEISSPKINEKYLDLSRDKWKERALDYQKEIREMQTQIRDLTRSKTKWRVECLQLRSEISKLREKDKRIMRMFQEFLNQ